MSIPLLNQGDPSAPIDAERLAAEFQSGLELWMDVPLSKTHLACLALAAQRATFQVDCSEPVRQVLMLFLGWCSQHADFELETRKLLAEQAEAYRQAIGADSNGLRIEIDPAVQTPGQPESGLPQGAADVPSADSNQPQP